MNDKRFKWLLLAASVTVVIVAAIWKYPEAAKTNSKWDDKLGQYIYVDNYSIIHASRKCSRLNHQGLPSKRIKLDDMYFYFQDTPMDEMTFCPKCVNDKDYENIVKLMEAKK